ncbi:hypothetical protein HWI79_3341 [Cryptosporidium felis]|nr:hypothetical protein HWI79_3341 [Cryptosporidium felis]
MNKRKERPEEVFASSRELDDVEMLGFGEKRRNLNDCGIARPMLDFGAENEKENSRCPSSSSSSSSSTTRAGQVPLDPQEQNYTQLAQKYESLQNSHATLQKVVKSLLEKLSQLNEQCSQKDRELGEYRTQLKKLIDANETLNLYIQSSHSSLMSNSMINKFGSDIY